MHRPDGHAGVSQRVLGDRVTQLLEGEDIRGRNGSGAALPNPGGKMSELADAAAGNDWDRNPSRDAAQQLNIVPGAHAVTIDRIDEDFSGAMRSGVGGPIGGKQSGRPAAASTTTS